MMEAGVHLKFCIEIYRKHLRGGRHFLHEHPVIGTSWREQGMADLLADDRTISVISDLCQFNPKTTDTEGNVRPATKPTRLLSSRDAIARRLGRRCPHKHKHAVLLGDRAAAAAEYTNELCIEILRGVQDQLEKDRGRCAEALLATLGVGEEPLELMGPDHQKSNEA